MTRTVILPVNAPTSRTAETVVARELARRGKRPTGIVATESPDQRHDSQVAIFTPGRTRTWDVRVDL